MARARRSRGESLFLRYLILGTWALFCLVPVLWFLSIGFRPRTEIITPQPIYFPTFSLDAWHMIWEDWPMAKYLRNSVLAILGSVLIDLVLAIPAAYSLARFDYRGLSHRFSLVFLSRLHCYFFSFTVHFFSNQPVNSFFLFQSVSSLLPFTLSSSLPLLSLSLPPCFPHPLSISIPEINMQH